MLAIACGCLLLTLTAAVPVRPHDGSDFELVVGLKLHNLDKLEEDFWQVATPGSGDYLQFRTVSELSSLVGASRSDIDAAKTWLVGEGADPSSLRVSALGDTITAKFRNTPQHWGAQLPKRKQHPLALDFVLRRDPLVATTISSEKGAAVPTNGPSVSRQKKAYGIPTDLMATNDSSLQMVWGPGTFGYSHSELLEFKLTQCPKLNSSRVVYDTKNHGKAGGDNFGEGTLDTLMISAYGLNIKTLVSNTNTSSSTEEGNGFGQAMLDFITELASRDTVPQVLSLSLGSLSGASCDLLCNEAAKKGVAHDDCTDFLQQQRQVCMYLSEEQVARINNALKLLGLRGVSVFGSSGDGGSHFSFGPFSGGHIADVLNDISCEFQMPVFPTSSPYIISVGGTEWQGDDSSRPVAWEGSGGGFAWEFAAPKHQADVVAKYLSETSGVPPQSSFNVTGRAYPDVAAISADGTSQSSPTTAGIWSLLIDQRLNKGLPPLGFLAPRLWQTAVAHPGEITEDITQGNSQTSCDNGFPATTGWDPVTGWGRPNWTGMMKHFGTDDNLSSLIQ